MLRANQDRLLEEQQQRDRFNLNSIVEDSDTDTDPTDQLTFRHEDSDASRVGSIVSRADVNTMRSHDEARRSSKVDGHPSNAGSKGGVNVSNMSALSGQRSVSHDGGDRDDASEEDFTTHTHHSQSSNSLYRASSAPAVVGTRPVDSKDIDPERPITVGADAAAVLRNNNNNSNSPTKIKSKTALSLLAVKHNTLMDDSSSSIDNSAFAMSGNNEASRLEELSHDERFMREGDDSDQAEESELIDDDAELQAFHHRRLTAGYNAASGDRDDDDDDGDDAAEEEQSIEEDISPSMISESRRVIEQQLFSGNDTTFLSDDNPTATASSSHHYSDDFECPEHEADFSSSSSEEEEEEGEGEEADEVKDRDDATRVVHRREAIALSAAAGMHTGTGSTYFPRPCADDVAFWSSLKSMSPSLDVLEGITRRRRSSDGSCSRGLRDRLEYLHSEYFSYWQQGSCSPAEGPIDSEALSTMMSDAMEVCKRAIEYSIAVVNISLERPKEPSFLPDYFPETGAASTGGIESLLLLFQQGSMQWLQLAIAVCSAFCSFVPSFISICEHLAARVCDKTAAVVKVGFVAVLASCAGVIGSAIYLPQDDELHSSKPFQAAINRCYSWAISTNAPGATRADIEAQVYGLSISDKWCLMALLAELLKTVNRKSDVVGSVLLQTLMSLNTLLSHASLSTFNMIVAQQIPSLVCDSAIDKVHALYKHVVAEATAGKHTGSGSNRVSVMKGLLLHLAHAYSLLLSPTTTPSWGIHCPIPCGIDSTSSGSSQDQSSEFDAHSSQVMLRLRVCRGMTDKLCQDDDGRRDRSGLHKLLLLTCELFSEGNNNNTLYRSLSDQLLAFTRTDLINTLLHLTELNGRSFCAAISSYDNGRMIDCLMKQMKAISSGSSGYDHPQDEDAVRSSMCLLVLTRLLASQSLTGDAVVSITRIVVTSAEQMSRRQARAPVDHRHYHHSCIGDSWSKQMYACFDWLAEVTRTLIRVSETHNELTQETQRQLLALVNRLASDERFVMYLVRVLEAFSKHPHPSEGDQHQLPPSSCYPRVQFTHLAQYGYPSVIFVWNSLSSSSTASVMGGEFGVRLHGCLDGLCELISHVSSLCHANHAVTFDIHSEAVTHLVETLCCAISQGVRTMLDGHYPHL